MPNHLILDLPAKSFLPGDTLSGEIIWEFVTPPDSLYVSLGWWTSGRGERDERVVAEQEWKSPGTIGKESFVLQIPESIIPSFSGRLVSLEWGIQVSAKGVKIDDVVEIVTISPTKKEIDISAETYKSKGKSVSIRNARMLSLSNRR